VWWWWCGVPRIRVRGRLSEGRARAQGEDRAAGKKKLSHTVFPFLSPAPAAEAMTCLRQLAGHQSRDDNLGAANACSPGCTDFFHRANRVPSSRYLSKSSDIRVVLRFLLLIAGTYSASAAPFVETV
jgi:hypothetical protein